MNLALLFLGSLTEPEGEGVVGRSSPIFFWFVWFEPILAHIVFRGVIERIEIILHTRIVINTTYLFSNIIGFFM